MGSSGILKIYTVHVRRVRRKLLAVLRRSKKQEGARKMQLYTPLQFQISAPVHSSAYFYFCSFCYPSAEILRLCSLLQHELAEVLFFSRMSELQQQQQQPHQDDTEEVVDDDIELMETTGKKHGYQEVRIGISENVAVAGKSGAEEGVVGREMEKKAPGAFERTAVMIMALCIAATVGTYIRMLLSYYNIWSVDTNYCIMYGQMLGSAIFGFVSKHKLYLHGDRGTHSLRQVLFVSITSALCGSITTFSSWQLMCNRNFLLQWDLTWDNFSSSYNGGRFIEWAVSLVSGVVMPLASLRFGQHCAALTPFHNEQIVILSTSNPEAYEALMAPSTRLEECKYTGILVAIFAVALFCVFGVPWLIDSSGSYIYITYCGVFGAVGALTRYALSLLFNDKSGAAFPANVKGTFIANVGGAWLAAVLTTVSKFFVNYYDVEIQAVLYGLLTGYCGCLTTVSSFVNELDTLPLIDSYKYGVASNVMAQIGIILIFDVYAFRSVPVSSVMPEPINACVAAQNLCGELLYLSGCPEDYIVNNACTNNRDYSTYIGECSCGQFTTIRVNEKIVDAQAKSNVSKSLVPIWPANSLSVGDPTQVFDYCLSYENTCDHYLNRIGCDEPLRTNNGCSRYGILHKGQECTCGTHKTASSRIGEIITDVTLARRYDLVDYAGYITLSYVDVDKAYKSLCKAMLDHVQCPHDRIVNIANAVPGNFSTWVGQCSCGSSYDVNSQRVAENLFDATMRGKSSNLIVRSPSSSASARAMSSTVSDSTSRVTVDVEAGGSPFQLLAGNESTFDICTSYNNICSAWLNIIQCPSDLQTILGCGIGITQGQPTNNSSNDDSGSGPDNGSITQFTGKCICGTMSSLTARPFEMYVDSLIAESLMKEYYYSPSPNKPYITMVSSNPFYQLQRNGMSAA